MPAIFRQKRPISWLSEQTTKPISHSFFSDGRLTFKLNAGLIYSFPLEIGSTIILQAYMQKERKNSARNGLHCILATLFSEIVTF